MLGFTVLEICFLVKVFPFVNNIYGDKGIGRVVNN